MRKLSASAQKLAARSQKESILAFASLDGKIEKAENSSAEMSKSVLSSYSCKACSTVFVAQADTTPFCVTCGSHHVAEKAKVETSSLQLSDEKLSAVICAQCGSGSILSKEVVASSEGHLHCTTCGTSMTIDVAALAPAKAKAEAKAEAKKVEKAETELIVVDAPNTPAGPVAVQAEDLSELDFEDEDEDLDDEIEVDLDTAEAVDTQLDGAPGAEPMMNVDEVRPEDVTLENADIYSDDFNDALDTMSGDDDLMVDEEEDEDFVYSDLDEGDDLYDTMDMDDTADDLDMFPLESRMIVTKGFVSVATLNIEKSKRDPQEIQSKAFKEAFHTIAAKDGMRKAIAKMGFKPIKTKTVSQATVEAERAKATKEAETKIAAAQAEIEESVALAAAGLARDQWSNIENPLRVKLVSLLSRSGVKDAERLAARFCQDVSEPYTSALMKVAANLQKQGPQLRNVLANAFSMTKAEVVTDNEEEVVLDEITDVTSSLMTNVEPLEERMPAVASMTVLHKIQRGNLNLG